MISFNTISMKYVFLIIASTFYSLIAFPQKQSFDIVSYSSPANWEKVQNEGGVQLSITDKKSGAYAIAIITKSSSSNLSASENFTVDWKRLVKAAVQVKEEPNMQEPSAANGWNIISGTTNYTDGNTKGLATLITATGGGQMVSVLLMTNTEQYQNDLLSFIQSLELSKVSDATSQNPVNIPGPGNKSIVGLWTYNTLEISGYINGMPQYTAGYSRREYAFYQDGKYLFRTKIWLTLVKDILYVYESGTYTVSENQIVLTPLKGKGEFWSKKDNTTSKWGSLVRSSDFKLEKTTYRFELKYYSGSQHYDLILIPVKETQRDGTLNGDGYHYSLKESGISVIDNPPGLKTGFEDKSFTASVKTTIANHTTIVAIHSPLAGKIWECTTTEKFSNAGGTGYNTAGFETNQYLFNTDGTYRFVAVIASHYIDTKTLSYETGTYTISGNQLTIIPAKGYNEEWSKIGKTSNGNSDVSNRAINETWGKKIKTSIRKLEKVNYTFSIGQNGDRTALILQYPNGHTEREGNGSQTYLNETTAEKSVKLPAAVN